MASLTSAGAVTSIPISVPYGSREWDVCYYTVDPTTGTKTDLPISAQALDPALVHKVQIAAWNVLKAIGDSKSLEKMTLINQEGISFTDGPISPLVDSVATLFAKFVETALPGGQPPDKHPAPVSRDGVIVPTDEMRSPEPERRTPPPVLERPRSEPLPAGQIANVPPPSLAGRVTHVELRPRAVARSNPPEIVTEVRFPPSINQTGLDFCARCATKDPQPQRYLLSWEGFNALPIRLQRRMLTRLNMKIHGQQGILKALKTLIAKTIKPEEPAAVPVSEITAYIADLFEQLDPQTHATSESLDSFDALVDRVYYEFYDAEFVINEGFLPNLKAMIDQITEKENLWILTQKLYTDITQQSINEQQMAEFQNSMQADQMPSNSLLLACVVDAAAMLADIPPPSSPLSPRRVFTEEDSSERSFVLVEKEHPSDPAFELVDAVTPVDSIGPAGPYVEIKIPMALLLDAQKKGGYSLLKCGGRISEFNDERYVVGLDWQRLKPTVAEKNIGWVNLLTHLDELLPNAGAQIDLVTFQNGINVAEERFGEISRLITEKIPEGPLYIGKYNPKTGQLANVCRTGAEKFTPLDTQVVVMMQIFMGYLLREIARINPNLKLLHISHSEGTLIFSNAMNKLPQEIQDTAQKQLISLSLGGATKISSTRVLEAINGCSQADVISRALNPWSSERVFVSAKTPFGGMRTGNVIDHRFKGETYQEFLAEVVEELRQRHSFYMPPTDEEDVA